MDSCTIKENCKHTLDLEIGQLVSYNATVHAPSSGLYTPPVELKYMDTTVSAIIFLVYIQFWIILIFICLNALVN
ncbi:hypothetical protein FQA39_LY02182 [Lamprigera yunnana]|nr:hypothetical protein FQA39_LY02182 [Lamprigera yunnana]